MSKNDEFVTFQNSAGEEISNDPRWHAKRVLEEAGMSKAEDFDIPGPYDSITDGKELKQLAKDRGISTVGIRKASVIRDLLEQWDEDQEKSEDDDSDSDDDNDESTGDNESGDSDNSEE